MHLAWNPHNTKQAHLNPCGVFLSLDNKYVSIQGACNAQVVVDNLIAPLGAIMVTHTISVTII